MPRKCIFDKISHQLRKGLRRDRTVLYITELEKVLNEIAKTSGEFKKGFFKVGKLDGKTIYFRTNGFESGFYITPDKTILGLEGVKVSSLKREAFWFSVLALADWLERVGKAKNLKDFVRRIKENESSLE